MKQSKIFWTIVGFILFGIFVLMLLGYLPNPINLRLKDPLALVFWCFDNPFPALFGGVVILFIIVLWTR